MVEASGPHSEISQIQHSFMKSEIVNLESKRRMMVVGLDEREMGSYQSMHIRFQLRKMNNF